MEPGAAAFVAGCLRYGRSGRAERSRSSDSERRIRFRLLEHLVRGPGAYQGLFQERQARQPYALEPGAGFSGNRGLPQRGAFQGVRRRIQGQKAARMELEPAGRSRNGEAKDRSGDRRRGGSERNTRVLVVARAVEAGSGSQGERDGPSDCPGGRGSGGRRFCKAVTDARQATRAGVIPAGSEEEEIKVVCFFLEP